MKKRYKIKIYGDVQGVLYRFTARQIAQKLGINGWVRNEYDGSVLIVAEGEKEALDKLVKWCYEGPPLAEVSEVEIEEGEYKDEFGGFEAR